MSLQYGKLRPANGCDLLASLWHPSKFQMVSRLGSASELDCVMEFGLKQRTILPICHRPNFMKVEHNTPIGVVMNPSFS